MLLSNIVGPKTNTIAAWLIGILFLVLSTNALRALEFKRHSADSAGLTRLRRRVGLKPAILKNFLDILEHCLGSRILQFT